MANTADQDRDQLLDMVRDEWLQFGTSCEETVQLERERCE